LVAFIGFWLMFAVFSLLGGRFDLTSALIFGASSLVLGKLVHRRRSRRHDVPSTTRNRST
jgi:hypothetical protein